MRRVRSRRRAGGGGEHLNMSGRRAGIDYAAQPLGRVSDAALARRLGVNRSAVERARQRRGVAACPREAAARAGADLGAADDATVATRHGLSTRQVQYARWKRGIATPCTRHRVDWRMHGLLLGTMWDRHLAGRLGLTTSAVSEARARRGIPCYRERRMCACGAEFVAAHPARLVCSPACGTARRDAQRYYGSRGVQVDVRVALMALRRVAFAMTRGGTA